MTGPVASRPPLARRDATRKGPRLRILGGELRGRRLAVANGVRPTEARLREALFSIWSQRLGGCRFLDLFAGSGAVGLEALSRGAGSVVFAEADPRVLRVLARHLGELAPETSRVWRRRLPGVEGPAPGGGAFDLIFADPPYRFSDYQLLMERASAWLAPDGELAIEHSSKVTLADVSGPWRCADRRRYGDCRLSFFRLDRPAAADRSG